MLLPDTPISELVSLSTHVSPTVIKTVGGDYLLVWRLEGLPFVGREKWELEHRHNTFNRLLQTLRAPDYVNVAFWVHDVRRRGRIRDNSRFTHRFNQDMSDGYYSSLFSYALMAFMAVMVKKIVVATAAAMLVQYGVAAAMGSSPGMSVSSMAMMQGGLGLLLTTALVTVPPIAAYYLANKNGQTYGFDYGNRLRYSSAQESYRYDANGRRVSAFTPSPDRIEIRSFYDARGVLRYQHDFRRSKVLNYVYFAGSLVGQREASMGASDHVLKFQHTDALGSPVATTDGDRNVLERGEYAPFGTLLNRSISDGPGYTGHVMDAATGLSGDL